MNDVPDRIEKRLELRAPCARVWEAISDAERFGTWFGAEFDGPFVAGQTVIGRIRPSRVDARMAAAQAPYAGTPMDITIERLEPPHVFAFRWKPGADQELEVPSTLVTFELTEIEGGTLLTLSESGFHAVPLPLRARIFSENDGGWTMQAGAIRMFVEGDPR